MNPIQGPWTLSKFPEGFYKFPIVFFCVLRHFFAVGLLIIIRLTFRWYIPTKNPRISKNHTHTSHTRMIYRGKYVGEPMWTTTLALGKVSANSMSLPQPTQPLVRFGFEKDGDHRLRLLRLDRIVNIPTYARASWGSWEKRRKGRVRVSMKFLHHWKGHFIPGEKLGGSVRCRKWLGPHQLVRLTRFAVISPW